MPPRALPRPTKLKKHGHLRIDNYYWLNDRDNPEVMAHLTAENDYAKAAMGHKEDLVEVLFDEIQGRIKQTDFSVPFKLDEYLYYTRYEEGKEYPIYCRKRKTIKADEEVMLDVNILANGYEYCAVGDLAISFGNNILAYAVDTQGRRIYSIRFKNLKTGELFPDVISETTGNLAWANNDEILFYGKQDPLTLRPFQVFRHSLGMECGEDTLVYEEADATFSTSVFKTKSKQYLMIVSHQTVSTEYRYLDANDSLGEFQVLCSRERDHEYDVDHYGDSFYIRTNFLAKNFRLMTVVAGKTGKEYWQELIPHREDAFLESFELFRDYLVIEDRKQGLMQLRIFPWEGEGEHYINFDEPTYLAYLGENHEFNTPLLRFIYTSMTTPISVFDYNMKTREKILLKQEEILGGFDKAHYQTERLWISVQDGTQVPVSLVYRKGLLKNGKNPLLLYGYGAYGISMDASFSSSRLSLLDRGFVFAIAHVRGGQEFGREWYEQGKLLNKKNTFTDFIDCAEHLLQTGYTSQEQLFAMGGSAGGLLVGVVANMRPDLFKGVVAQVPFVDVVTTMLDPNIPLTTGEYDEWGDPNQKNYYEYILSYSPHDNVQAKAYPHLLVTAGLHDSQVQYWEPAKWVAKIRAIKTDEKLVLLKTTMDAGHGGLSGRFRRFKEIAFIYAFLLDFAGVDHKLA